MKPLRYIDDQVLKFYTHLARKYEDKTGKSKYDLARKSNAGVLISSLGGFMEGIGFNNFSHLIVPSLGVPSYFVYNSFINLIENVEDITSETIVTKRESGYIFRLFCVGGSLAETIIGVHRFAEYINYMNSESLENLLSTIPLIGFCYGVTSIFYLLKTDPKLLDKNPFWKDAYNSVKKKVESILPKPIPTPQPGPTSFKEISNFLGGN